MGKDNIAQGILIPNSISCGVEASASAARDSLQRYQWTLQESGRRSIISIS